MLVLVPNIGVNVEEAVVVFGKRILIDDDGVLTCKIHIDNMHVHVTFVYFTWSS